MRLTAFDVVNLKTHSQTTNYGHLKLPTKRMLSCRLICKVRLRYSISCISCIWSLVSSARGVDTGHSHPWVVLLGDSIQQRVVVPFLLTTNGHLRLPTKRMLSCRLICEVRLRYSLSCILGCAVGRFNPTTRFLFRFYSPRTLF